MQSYDIDSKSYTATVGFQEIIPRSDNRQYLFIWASSGNTQICFDTPGLYDSFTLYEGDGVDFVTPTNAAIFIAGNGSTIVVCTNGLNGDVPPPPTRVYLKYNGIVLSDNSVQLYIED